LLLLCIRGLYAFQSLRELQLRVISVRESECVCECFVCVCVCVRARARERERERVITRTIVSSLTLSPCLSLFLSSRLSSLSLFRRKDTTISDFNQNSCMTSREKKSKRVHLKQLRRYKGRRYKGSIKAL
jgi:hypothetical protein